MTATSKEVNLYRTQKLQVMVVLAIAAVHIIGAFLLVPMETPTKFGVFVVLLAFAGAYLYLALVQKTNGYCRKSYQMVKETPIPALDEWKESLKERNAFPEYNDAETSVEITAVMNEQNKRTSISGDEK